MAVTQASYGQPAVYNASLPSLSDGQACALQVDSKGRLISVLEASDFVDDDTFSVGSDKVLALGALADETSPDSVDEGDIGIPRMTLDRRLHVSSSYAEDAAHVSGDYGAFVLAVRNDTLAALAGTDGDYAPLQVDASGALYIVVSGGIAAQDAAVTGNPLQVSFEAADFDGSALPNTVDAEGDIVRPKASLSGVPYFMPVNEDGSKTLLLAEDAAHVSGDLGVMTLSVRQDTAAALADTDGDYQPLITDANGKLHVVSTVDEAIYVDDADWTDTTSKHMLVGGLYQSSKQTITDGDVGPIQLDQNGRVESVVGGLGYCNWSYPIF